MTDDVDPRLRPRLAALAEAVPLRPDTIRPVRPESPVRSRLRGAPGLVVVAVVLSCVVVGIAFDAAGRVSRNGTPPPAITAPGGGVGSPGPSRIPAATTSSPEPSPTPRMTRPPSGVALPYPDGCPAYGLSPRRCAYIVDWALRQAGVPASDAEIELLGDPDCDGQSSPCIPTVRLGGNSFVVRVRVIPATGDPSDHSVFCGLLGSDRSFLCTEMPRIVVGSPMGGYHDVPCGPEPAPEGVCATPPPPIAPAAAEKSRALRVRSLDVAIDHVGTYSIDIGAAILPNGVLSEASASLADPYRNDVLIPEGIQLQVVGEDGDPIVNAYQHVWHRGVERVTVRLVFTVEALDRPTTLELTDVVVR